MYVLNLNLNLPFNFMSKKLISVIVTFSFFLTASGPDYLFALRPPCFLSAPADSEVISFNSTFSITIFDPKTDLGAVEKFQKGLLYPWRIILEKLYAPNRELALLFKDGETIRGICLISKVKRSNGEIVARIKLIESNPKNRGYGVKFFPEIAKLVLSSKIKKLTTIIKKEEREGSIVFFKKRGAKIKAIENVEQIQRVELDEKELEAEARKSVMDISFLSEAFNELALDDKAINYKEITRINPLWKKSQRKLETLGNLHKIKFTSSEKAEAISLKDIYSEQGVLVDSELRIRQEELKGDLVLPIEVLKVKLEEENKYAYLILDGNHRWVVGLLLGLETINAYLFERADKKEVIIGDPEKLKDLKNKYGEDVIVIDHKRLTPLEKMLIPLTTELLPPSLKGKVNQEELEKYFVDWAKEKNKPIIPKTINGTIQYYLEFDNMRGFKVYLLRVVPRGEKEIPEITKARNVLKINIGGNLIEVEIREEKGSYIMYSANTNEPVAAWSGEEVTILDPKFATRRNIAEIKEKFGEFFGCKIGGPNKKFYGLFFPFSFRLVNLVFGISETGINPNENPDNSASHSLETKGISSLRTSLESIKKSDFEFKGIKKILNSL